MTKMEKERVGKFEHLVTEGLQQLRAGLDTPLDTCVERLQWAQRTLSLALREYQAGKR